MIDYSQIRNYTDPPSLTSRPQWATLLNWTLSVITVPNGRISFLFLEITNVQFDSLKTNCPFLVNPDVNLHTFRAVLYHLTNPPRLSDTEKANICTLLNTAIGDDEQDSKNILLSYYPAANPARHFPIGPIFSLVQSNVDPPGLYISKDSSSY